MAKKWKVLLLSFLTICAIITLSIVCVPHVYATSETSISISPSQYDTYTNTDANLNNYNINQRMSSVAKFGKDLLLSVWNDDEIVKIIPRELFTKNGEYLYIGKEYGFFVNTFSDTYYDSETETYSTSSKNKHSYVLVFDITNDLHYQNSDTVQITVAPVFQYEYAYIDATESYLSLNGTSGYNLSGYRKKAIYDLSEGSADNFVVLCPRFGTSVVYQQETRYYLKDISFGLSLYNEQALNEGDQGYQAINDEGSFFLNLDYKYNGIVRERGAFPVKETITLAKDVAKLLLTKGLGKVANTLNNLLNLTELASGIGNAINFISGIENFVNPSDIETGNGIITATYLQNDLNNKLIKGVGAAINTANAESVWYKVGNTCSITAQTMHTAKGREPNYMRLNREIGLKIVDVADDSTVMTGLTSEQLNMHSRVYKPITMEQPNEIILLPNGTNYFQFTPQFASHYRFDFETDNGCELYIDGQKIANSSVSCDVYLSPKKHNIEVRNQDGVQNSFTVSPKVYDVSNQEFSVKPNEEYVIKLNVDGIRAWKLSDPDFIFTSYYYNNFSDASKTALGGTQEAVIRKSPNEILYVVVKNTSSIEKSVYLTDSDVQALTLNENGSFNISAIDTYVSFEAPEDGTYYLSVLTTNVLFTGSVYHWNGSNKEVTESTYYRDKYQISLNAGQQIYFRFRGFNGEIKTITTVMKKYNYTVYWYKEENGYTTRIASEVRLQAGSNVKLYVMFDDVTKIEPNNIVWHCNSNFRNGLAINGENIMINDACSLGNLFNLGVSYVSGGFYFPGATAETNRLEVFIIPRLTEIFKEFENTDNLGFYWNCAPNVTGIEYSYSDGHSFSGNENVDWKPTDTVNYVNLLSLNYTSFYDITIRISKISYKDYLSGSHTIETRESTHTVPSVFASSFGSNVDISYLRHFQNMTKGGVMQHIRTYNQVADIMPSNVLSNSNPMANAIFNKTYNGNYHALNTFYYDDTGSPLLIGGFCGANHGTIENLDLVSVVIGKNATNVGGMVGINWNTIRNCTVDTWIDFEDSDNTTNFGGVAGYSSGKLTNIEVRPLIKVSKSAGGLVGVCAGSTIENCHVGINSATSVSSPSEIYIKKYADIAVGGLIGEMTASSNNKISGCTVSIDIKYTAPVSNNTNNLIAPKIGGVVGWKKGGTVTNTTFSGTISTGTLKVLSYGFLGLTKFDQKKNVSNYIGLSS